MRYYPFLSAGLLICLLVSTYWQTTADNASRVAVHLFRGKISGQPSNFRSKSMPSDQQQQQRQQQPQRDVNIRMAAEEAMVPYFDSELPITKSIQHIA